MKDWYQNKINELKERVKAYSAVGDLDKVEKLNREIANYQSQIKPSGVDRFLS